MASVAQIEANRLNAQKSTGPRTPEGKEKASRNAVKHGLLAEQVVIHGEDPAEFDGYRDRMLGELAPVGEVERMLAERAVGLAWRLRRAERLQSAVFARVYRENADDIVLWPKHGLPIQPGPDEEEVILGQVVMADFGHAKVLDRLVVYERRIEGSFYRTMAELRREKRARVAEEGQASRRAGTPAAKPCRTFPSHGRVAEEGACTPTTGELGSFGVEEKRTPDGVTTGGNHGRDARATKGPAELGSFGVEEKRTPDGVATGGNHGRDARATEEAAELGSFGVEEKRTPDGVTTGGNHGRDARATKGPAELGSFGVEAERTPDGVSTHGDHGRDARATEEAAELGSFAMEEKRTPDGVATGGDHGRDARATEEAGESGSFGREAKGTPDGVATKAPTGGNQGRDARATEAPAERSCETKPISGGGLGAA